MTLMKITTQNENNPSIDIQIDSSEALLSFLKCIGNDENFRYDQLIISNTTGSSLTQIWEQIKNLTVETISEIEIFNKDGIKVFNSTSSIRNIRYATNFDDYGIAETIIFIFEK